MGIRDEHKTRVCMYIFLPDVSYIPLQPGYLYCSVGVVTLDVPLLKAGIVYALALNK